MLANHTFFLLVGVGFTQKENLLKLSRHPYFEGKRAFDWRSDDAAVLI